MIFTAVFLYAAICIAENQTPLDIQDSIRTPEDLAQWFSSKFTYAMEIPDRWQKAEETLSLKTGDCEDFAILSRALLDKMGIRCEIVIVEFKGLPMAHAICAWQDAQKVNLMSNGKLYKIKADSIESAIKKVYPDWKKIRFANK